MLTIILLSVAGAVILILAIALGISTDEAVRANRFDPEWLKESVHEAIADEFSKRAPVESEGRGGSKASQPSEMNALAPEDGNALDSPEGSEDLDARRDFEKSAMDLDATQRARAALAREKAEFEAYRDREKARLMKAETDMKQRLTRYY